MIRSFDYISHAGLIRQVELGTLRENRLPQLEPWRAFWYWWVGWSYIIAYAKAVREGDLLPQSTPELRVLLKVHLLEKAVHEISWELANRPAWARIPMQAILDLLERWDDGVEKSEARNSKLEGNSKS
jgi:maltose alpha-D-glucosyltransferase/alpha-amylase